MHWEATYVGKEPWKQRNKMCWSPWGSAMLLSGGEGDLVSLESPWWSWISGVPQGPSYQSHEVSGRKDIKLEMWRWGRTCLCAEKGWWVPATQILSYLDAEYLTSGSQKQGHYAGGSLRKCSQDKGRKGQERTGRGDVFWGRSRWECGLHWRPDPTGSSGAGIVPHSWSL